MKTIGAVLLSSMGCLIVVENRSEPGGDTHTFEPRPRPATCVVAVHVKPGGILESNLMFLLMLATELASYTSLYFSSSVLVLVTTSP